MPDFVLKVLREILVVLIPIEYSFGHSVWRCLLFLVVYPRCRNNFLPSRRRNNALIFPLDSAHHLMEMTMAIAEARYPWRTNQVSEQAPHLKDALLKMNLATIGG
jgi:hypothetical protein